MADGAYPGKSSAGETEGEDAPGGVSPHLGAEPGSGEPEVWATQSSEADRLSFGLIEPGEAPRPRPKPRFPWLALASFLCALIVVATVRSLWLRTLLPLALVAGGVVLLLRYRTRAARRADRPSGRRAPRALVLDASGLRYEPVRRGTLPTLSPTTATPLALPAAAQVFEGAGAFGATLLSNARRDRLALAITSQQGTFLIGTRLDEETRKSFADLFFRSWVLGSDDAALDATGPDGQPVCLPPATFRKLYESLVSIDPSCARRLVLSDQRQSPLRLDGEALVARGARFDLSRPVEWRPILFQESFGHAITLYQGTWVRQGANEIVLVSLLTPSLFESTTRAHERTGVPELDRMAIRDQRLLQATASDPPPVEQRVAMDGLFVLPLRAALDDAPRPSSVDARPRHP